MTEIKVGDTVRFTDTHCPDWIGQEGVVESLSGRSVAYRITKAAPTDLDAYWNTVGDLRTNNASQLELVKPEPKFAVGDWVKVHGRHDKWDGTVGTVVTVSPKSYSSYGHLYTILRNNKAVGEDHTLRFFEGALVATEAPKPEFSVGDKVRQKTGVNGHSLLDVLTVESLHPAMYHSVFVTNSKGSVFAYQPCELEKVTFASGGVIKQDSGKLYSYAEFDAKLTAKVIGKFEEAEPEAVKHPAHYGGDTTYEAIKVIEAWGLGFNLGNAAKYLARAGKKGNKVEDLNKLIQYVQFEIALEEAK